MKGAEETTRDTITPPSVTDADADDLINVSGHKQEVDRIFDLFSTISLAITCGNVWPSLAGSITVAIYNGGAPGFIYEFITVAVFYWFVAASIAELASAIPSAGGVYHWATVTAGPRYGKLCGFMAGWWNYLAWLFGTASTLQISANIIISMWRVSHPGFVEQRWMVFVVYIILCWFIACVAGFANKALPRIEQVGGFFVVVGFLITVIVCAIMPKVNGQPYATSSFVWTNWENGTGYTSNGLVFVLGMLNGAFAVGTPDVTSHLAEEIPKPQINIPYAMLAQYSIGFITGLFFLIPIMYGIFDLSEITAAGTLFPLADIYVQVTGSAAATIGLLFLVLIPVNGSTCGCYLTSSRVFWTLARDRATPFSGFFSTINPRFKVPLNAIMLNATLCTVLGCIYLGNLTAFTAFVSSFVVLTSASYVCAILPNLLSGRSRLTPGPFWMKGAIGFVVNAVAGSYMLAFIVIFCFPFAMPVSPLYMNYTCVIFGGFTIIVGAFYLILKKNYEGPKVVHLEGVAEMTVAEYRAQVSSDK
ncbi:hypothetical protein LTR37_008479 [Vermiconidia calcicola]|uniref:Uncharacterized protein n=1 Tax=Vermiconidia calcicola TaxID=1690605 RepID=A0ACC3NAR8_9PEZI|nr:hypothetical protein LTR37_008479 [Vermiconidia calcicola]